MKLSDIPQNVENAVDRLKQRPVLRGTKTFKYIIDDPTLGEEERLAALRKQLNEHMLETYRLLRIGMGWLAIAYPFVLVGLGLLLFNVAWQPSISDYYYALPRGLDLPAACLLPDALPTCAAGWAARAADMAFPVRSFFCGGLIAIGFFLILYKGTSSLEDWALNLAGIFAIGVAIFPMNKVPFASTWPTWAHFASAALLFVCMAFIARFCAKDTLACFRTGSPEIPYYRGLYRLLSLLMLGVLALGVVYWFAKGPIETVLPSALFWIEAMGVLVFGSYWVIKSREISKHQFGRKAQT